jgi:hypothetical protein
MSVESHVVGWLATSGRGPARPAGVAASPTENKKDICVYTTNHDSVQYVIDVQREIHPRTSTTHSQEEASQLFAQLRGFRRSNRRTLGLFLRSHTQRRLPLAES